MKELSDKRIGRFADQAAEQPPEELTAEFERETLEDGVPRTTNDSTVRETGGAQKTEIFVNDYEKALPEHYRLLRMIGRGGMAEVFLAEDQRLGRNVAIKFLNSEFRREPDRMRRFNQEARAASALNHPNILIIHDIGETEGVQFIVSEFVEGETLGAKIARGKLPIAEAVRISIQIASALAASHNAGIVHRDIKPDNVMIRRDGSVKILDFGLAKDSGAVLYNSNGTEALTLEGAATSPGLILGTPQYMSPEQARGKPLDTRTDIFSFGVILFEMVTGKQPFPGSTMVDIIAAVIGKEPRPLAEFIESPPQLLTRIIEKTLRKEKEERYATTEHLLSDLRDLQREIADTPHLGRETKDAEVRPTRNNTVRSFLGTGPIKTNALLLALVALPVLAFIAWWVSSGRIRQETTLPAAMRMIPITNWNGGAGELVAAASFSPDARMIAFAATKTGSTEIWAKPVAGGDPIQVTKNGFYNQYPIWSPNNQELAFFSSRGGSSGIWRTSFAGGEQTQIASGISSHARPVLWSPSKRIYFQDGSELFAVDERTGEKSQVTNFELSGIKPRTIEISKTENAIAYSIRDNGQWKIITSAPNGDGRKEIASSNEQIDEFAWDPDGKSVTYSSSVDGAYQVFRSGAGFESPVQLSNGNLDFFVQDVSSDGAKILYGSVSETSDLWTVNIADGKQTTISNEVAAEFWPDVSPDGKSVIFQSVSQADRPFRGSIIIRSQTGPTAPMVASQEGFAPVWAPDGQWAAFFRRSDAGISIWRVRTSGGDAQKVADGGIVPPGYIATPYLKIGKASMCWSPDSSTIAYSARIDGVSNIHRVSADGSRNTAISGNSDPAESFGNPSWTRDGRYIAFLSETSTKGEQRKQNYRLWLFDPATIEKRMVFEMGVQFRFLGLADNGKDAVILEPADPTDRKTVPAATIVVLRSLASGERREIRKIENAYYDNFHLSDDGRFMAFVTREKDISRLWVTPVQGGEPKQLIAETDPKILFSSLAWSPDGRSIVFGEQTRTNLLSMLSN